jgi:hypothetical protein
VSIASSSVPNLAFKRTPNGRPRNGIMLIFTIARPAVWRRLTLRYAPGSYAQIPVERFERRVRQTACDHRRNHRAKLSAQPAGTAMGSRLKFTVAFAMRHHVFHPGTTVASAACDRHRVWPAEGASRLTGRSARDPMHVGASLWWASAALRALLSGSALLRGVACNRPRLRRWGCA